MSADFRGKGASPTNRCWYQSSRVIALSCGVKMSAVRSFSFVTTTRVTDGQTDGQTDRRTDRITTPKIALAHARAVNIVNEMTYKVLSRMLSLYTTTTTTSATSFTSFFHFLPCLRACPPNEEPSPNSARGPVVRYELPSGSGRRSAEKRFSAFRVDNHAPHDSAAAVSFQVIK